MLRRFAVPGESRAVGSAWENGFAKQLGDRKKTMNQIEQHDPQVWAAIKDEIERQRTGLEMIASENYTSAAVMEAVGSVLTNKYAEGYPGKRYYGGCEFVDVVEDLARDRAKELFGAEHANVQPHCWVTGKYCRLSNSTPTRRHGAGSRSWLTVDTSRMV